MSAAKIDLESSSAHNPAATGGGKSPRERILLQPQDYVGSVEKCTREIWVCEGNSLRRRVVTYVPGLYKIFDEVLTYAADNKQRDPSMDSLRVQVDVDECRISIYYNGQGVPIELHPDEGIYEPEMIFGHLSNYEEITGVKLANLFSTEFIIETVDSHLEKKYKQIFSGNMGKKSEPRITVCLQGVNWTKIIFKPDLAKFHMTHLDEDAIALIRKRVVDVASFLGTTVQVVFNGQRIQGLKNFPDYVLCYISSASIERDERLPRICQRVNDKLEVCVTRSEGTFQQVSFVNKFATNEGGTHVDYVANQIAACIAKFCSKHFEVEETEVKKHLWVFVNAFMENPTFDSPTRDALITPQESFGPRCELSDHFVKSVFQCIIGKLSPWNSSKDTKPSKRRRYCDSG
ncbi:unnamed protein product [Urochloa decumbens]|uniref:DNA topoisomerase 2 n=1 Tax=Urochloa decumbens TaxID=240449 RepID=A0ABC9G0E9_9POAL